LTLSVEWARKTSVSRHLFIVSRQIPKLYSHLAGEFSWEPNVTVILDRRQGERRRTSDGCATASADRRQSDRRLKTEVATKLSTLGYAFVRLG
jgi:hypothetical protein